MERWNNGFYTAFHKNIPAGISGCKKKRLNSFVCLDISALNGGDFRALSVCRGLAGRLFAG
jgi:hypothetical protein